MPWVYQESSFQVSKCVWESATFWYLWSPDELKMPWTRLRYSFSHIEWIIECFLTLYNASGVLFASVYLSCLENRTGVCSKLLYLWSGHDFWPRWFPDHRLHFGALGCLAGALRRQRRRGRQSRLCLSLMLIVFLASASGCLWTCCHPFRIYVNSCDPRATRLARVPAPGCRCSTDRHCRVTEDID